MRPTIFTLFAGGDLVGMGAKSAGFDVVGGVEYDAAIAEVARVNGCPVTVGRVEDVHPRTAPCVPDVLHASPVCKNASAANARGGEADSDMTAARAVALWIEYLRPPVFTLENVWGYRNFAAYKLIRSTLDRLGYWSNEQHLNAADFGVPQTRKRLILRACREGMVPILPPAEPWRGWYEAIEDLIPTLPESQFAAWQLERLPKELKTFIADSQNPQKPNLCRAADEPYFTVTAHNRPSHLPTAFLVGAGGYNGQVVTRAEFEPSFTQTTESLGQQPIRAWLKQGRVVKMTPRALARFQSVPDSYILPDKTALACTIIGNGVPCLMMEKIYRGIKECL